MAIIPGSAKVLNQYANVNTTYGGSNAMKAQSKWYTMDDVLETVEANIPGGGISGSGTTNYVTKFTGSEEVGNSQIFDNGTSVGIGTPIPSTKFQVVGTFKAGDFSNPSLDVGAAEISANVDNNKVILNSSNAKLGYYGGGIELGVKADGGNRVYFENSAAAKFGLEEGVEGVNILTSDYLIQNDVVPSDPLTPVKWIMIKDIDSGDTLFIPVYS
jgi:hypothetical protein